MTSSQGHELHNLKKARREDQLVERELGKRKKVHREGSPRCGAVLRHKREYDRFSFPDRRVLLGLRRLQRDRAQER